jgi:hypothetical protein
VDPLAERLDEELRASAGRRKRLLAGECDNALLEVAPRLQSDPGRRRRLLELLTQLESAGTITWSASRDRAVRPELPAFVALIERVESVTAGTGVENLPWRPELEWAYTLRLTSSERDVLAAVQGYRRDRSGDGTSIPHRERSLQLFGDEKRIDRLIRSRLFEEGRLSLDMLDTYWAAPPIAWTRTGGGGPIVVSENSASWHSLVSGLAGQVQAVAYGAGGAFAQSVAGLADIGSVTSVLYIGDLDAEGIAIPQRAAAAAEAAGVAVPVPFTELWAALVNAAPVHGQPAEPVPSEVADELCSWFGDTALAREVERLLAAGIRVPQEALTHDVIVGLVESAPCDLRPARLWGTTT